MSNENYHVQSFMLCARIWFEPSDVSDKAYDLFADSVISPEDIINLSSSEAFARNFYPG